MRTATLHALLPWLIKLRIVSQVVEEEKAIVEAIIGWFLTGSNPKLIVKGP